LISTHSIRVLGRDLQVKSVSTPEHVAQVEGLVNEKLAEAVAAVTGGDDQVIVVLAMMNLAEAYLAAQKELEAERAACRARVAGLIGRLDQQAV
jgi:cell division protein ZapA